MIDHQPLSTTIYITNHNQSQPELVFWLVVVVVLNLRCVVFCCGGILWLLKVVVLKVVVLKAGRRCCPQPLHHYIYNHPPQSVRTCMKACFVVVVVVRIKKPGSFGYRVW